MRTDFAHLRRGRARWPRSRCRLARRAPAPGSSSSPRRTARPSPPSGLRALGRHSPYNLVPGGYFEAGAAAWSLSGGASVVSGNEPWKVAGAGHSRSLKLTAGRGATSPAICVGLEHPTLRFFAKNNGALLSTLTVEVITET